MVYLKWFLFLIPSLAFDVIGRLLTPIVVCFASDDGWLPSWLSWFQTPDNSLDGDRGHKERWGTSTDAWPTYVRRVAWLWRNCGYGFNINVIGFKHQEGDVKEVIGDESVGDKTGVSGTCRWKVFREGKLVCFQIYFVRHYKIFGVWKCVRIGAGWKIWGNSQADIAADPYCPHWIYCNPFKGSGREDDK